jgi:hypothetical protein
MEALEAGARLLLIDEDTCATNFMVRDARMQVRCTATAGAVRGWPCDARCIEKCMFPCFPAPSSLLCLHAINFSAAVSFCFLWRANNKSCVKND